MSLFDRVRVPSDVTTASSHVHVMVSTSPTPYAASVAAHESATKSGASPSTVTVPRSPLPIVVEKSLSAASSMLPPLALIDVTERSEATESPSAITVVKTISAEPVPLE